MCVRGKGIKSGTCTSNGSPRRHVAPVVTLQIRVRIRVFQPHVISEGESTVCACDFYEYMPRDLPAEHAHALPPGLVHVHVYVPTFDVDTYQRYDGLVASCACHRPGLQASGAPSFLARAHRYEGNPLPILWHTVPV
jgi:hypothetical protein